MYYLGLGLDGMGWDGVGDLGFFLILHFTIFFLFFSFFFVDREQGLVGRVK